MSNIEKIIEEWKKADKKEYIKRYLEDLDVVKLKKHIDVAEKEITRKKSVHNYCSKCGKVIDKCLWHDFNVHDSPIHYENTEKKLIYCESCFKKQNKNKEDTESHSWTDYRNNN